jgi:methyl-accepting chemotaxis protein
MRQEIIDAPDTYSTTEDIVNTHVISQRMQFGLATSNFLFIGAGLTTVVMVIGWGFLPKYTQILAAALSLIPLVVGSGLYPVFHRQQKSETGAMVMSYGLLLSIAILPLLLPSALAGAVIGYFLLFTLSNAIQGIERSLLLTIIAIPFFIADIVLTILWTPDLFNEQLPEWAEAASGSVVGLSAILTGIFIVRQIIGGQEDAARQAISANLDIESQASQDQQQRKHFQTTAEKYIAFMMQVGEGNLTDVLEIDKTNTHDQMLLLGQSLNKMAINLKEMIIQVRESAQNLNTAAIEIQATTTLQTVASNQQSTAVAETVATVEEVRQTVLQTADRAQSVANASQQSLMVSQDGQQAISDTIDGMNMIQGRVGNTADTILMLSDRTQQIGDIIDAVNAIADQSKMLALNASIEAARAGEEGKGFAVVAMEVRQLAEQSREATARVSAILSEIQTATNSAVMATEEGNKGAESGMNLAELAGTAIRDLAATIETAAQASAQIAASTHQQTNGMDQLAAAMGQINQATSQAAASAQQTEHSVRDLLQMAQELEEATAGYQV